MCIPATVQPLLNPSSLARPSQGDAKPTVCHDQYHCPLVPYCDNAASLPQFKFLTAICVTVLPLIVRWDPPQVLTHLFCVPSEQWPQVGSCLHANVGTIMPILLL